MKEKLGRKGIVYWYVFMNLLKKISSGSMGDLVGEDDFGVGFDLRGQIMREWI